MNLMTKEEIKELVYQVEGFEIESETERQIDVYDEEENRFLTYAFLETLNIEDVFQFNSLSLDKEKFFNVFRSCVDLNMLLTVKKVVFINNHDELNELDEEYPEQYMDIERAVGIQYYDDGIVVINVYKIKELAKELAIGNTESFELAHGIWTTLIHELRHVITTNPIILEDQIPAEEAEEDRVEEYCIKVFEEYIQVHPDFMCFS